MGVGTDLYEFLGVFLITAGAVVAAFNDLRGDIIGFFLVLLADWFTARFFISSNELKESINPVEQTYYISIYAWPITYLFSFVTEEFVGITSMTYLFCTQFYLELFNSSFMASLTLFAASACSFYNSPMATSITGNIKDTVVTFFGFFLFDDVIPTPMFVTGVLISFAGAL
jgi:hypothetical protein